MKILNKLGDVKIGRQGEVVYQRKYGEQIRRQVSPKRAISSEAQEKHRQLYRDALDWRKQLSRPNRRYLEGYCIASGVVDSYHIPLPWSRFALKLYLQKVGFVIIEKPSYSYVETEGRFEYYTTGDDGQADIYGASWRGQTFTPAVAHKITSVKLKLYRFSNPGFLTVSIRDTSEGKPIGGDLCVGNTDGDTLPTGAPYEWREITLGDGHNLEAGIQYAIVIRALSGDIYNRVWLRRDGSSPTYEGGAALFSNDSGGIWNIYTFRDNMFDIYGTSLEETPVPGLLHVRHPALLTVVHKRGELTINGHDTLSSLDEEYLTKQVGLDVLSDDYIEATTLPGIKYAHTVR